MPDVCCDCGLPTTRSTKIISYGSRRVDRAVSEGGRILALLLGLLSLMIPGVPSHLRREGGATAHVSLKLKALVPQCESCSTNKIEPIQVDYEKATIKLLVHNKFKDQFRELNAG
jgi:hypothetical protein